MLRVEYKEDMCLMPPPPRSVRRYTLTLCYSAAWVLHSQGGAAGGLRAGRCVIWAAPIAAGAF